MNQQIAIEPRGLEIDEDADVFVPKNKPQPQKWLRCPQRAEDIKQLCQANGVKHMLYAAPHIALYIFGVTMQFFVDSVWAHVALSVLIGNQLYLLFILHHDCMHGTAFKNDFFNRLAGRLYATTFVMTFTVNRQTHMRHHAYITDPERDPDAYYFSGTVKQIWPRIWRYIEWYTVIALTRYGRKVRNIVLAEQALNVSIWTAIHLALFATDQAILAVYIFWLPMAVVALVINPITRGYEHAPITLFPKGDPRRLDMSRNAITIANRWLGYLWGNITYHVEHHAYIRCPAYNLQKLHAIFQEEKMQYLTAPYPLYKIWKGERMIDDLICNAPGKESR